jgi:hypothetical protein
MESLVTVTSNNGPTNQLAISKFETCSFRSLKQITKVSCCSTNNISGYKCELRNIFPLSYINHCEKCDKYRN